MLVGGVEEAARLRHDAQQIEIIAADFVAVDFNGRVMPEESRARVGIDGGHSGEGSVAAAKILEVGIGSGDKPEARPGFVA